MKKEIKTIEKDGYNGVYWPNPNGSKYCMIAMLGDDTKDMMAKGGVKWLQKKGLNVLTMSPAQKITVTITIHSNVLRRHLHF